MSKLNNNDQRGSLLAGAVLLSAALAMGMAGLLTLSRTQQKQALSLLSKNQLRRIVQEKFTQDQIALNKNIDLTQFSTSPVRLNGGLTESKIGILASEDPLINGSLYLVITATITAKQAIYPHQMRLETVLSATAPPSPSIEKGEPITVSDILDQQLRGFLGDNQQAIEETKRKVLDQLKTMLGYDAENMMSMEVPRQYRPPDPTKLAEMTEEESQSAFVLNPVSFQKPASIYQILVWKESYF